jgi:hypothetical protein
MSGRTAADRQEQLQLAMTIRSASTAATLALARAEVAVDLADEAGIAWVSRVLRNDLQLLQLMARALGRLSREVNEELPEPDAWVVRSAREGEG